MKKMYYIYHVPGVKVGCTKQPSKRLAGQGYSDYQLLEAYEDIYEASDREIYLQKIMGYPVDTIPYWKSVESLKGGGQRHVESGHIQALGKIMGKKCVENKIGMFGMSKEAKSESSSKAGKIGGKRNVESGHIQALGKTGVGGKTNKGKVWINNDIICVRVIPEKLEEYESQGYVKGRLKKKITAI
jgi:hypothetical protein